MSTHHGQQGRPQPAAPPREPVWRVEPAPAGSLPPAAVALDALVDLLLSLTPRRPPDPGGAPAARLPP